MPCGGIYPKEGSWAQHANAALGCYHCDLPCCELWCEEWDAPIHDRCVDAFLKTREGQIILDHGHEVVRLPQRRPGKTTYVHCRLCGKVHFNLFSKSTRSPESPASRNSGTFS